MEVANGLSMEQAIVVYSIEEEYDWLLAHYPGFRGIEQTMRYEKEKPFDVHKISLPDGREISVYFDISEFFDENTDDLPDWLK
jgi:hypothetical protein